MKETRIDGRVGRGGQRDGGQAASETDEDVVLSDGGGDTANFWAIGVNTLKG